LFIAINFPAEIKAAIAEVRNTLKKSAFHGNFTYDENLHLTLVFLGECDERQVEAVKSVMNDVHVPEVTLMLDRVGCFRRDGGDTWWIGLKENKSLSDLQANLSARLQQKGFVLESRKYVPHVTIGREVRLHDRFVPPKVSQFSFTAKSIELMKSERINGKLSYIRILKKSSN